MNRMRASILVVLVLFAAACAEGTVGADETTTTSPAETTTTEAAAAETTTTTAPDTTTTTAFSESTDAEQLLEVLSANAELTSGRIEGSITMTGLDPAEAGVTELSFGFATAFNASTGDGSFLLDMSSLADAIEAQPDDPMAGLAAGMFGTMEFRQVGDRAYMHAPALTGLFGAETPWLSMPAEDGEDFSSGFETVPSDPNEIFDTYEGADTTVENLGEERVNGVDATHYRITFDTSAMISELSPQERAELEESGIFADGLLPIDLWVSADGHLVRMVMEIDASMAPDGEFDTMSLRYDMFDIGQPVVVEAPPADEVTAIEDLEFGNFDFGFGEDA